MRRRDFLVNLGAGAASVFLGGCMTAAKKKAARPNILIIHIDDLGWTDLSCFGSKYYETPNIDRLAKQGMKFTNAYAACAVCSPTRGSLMTGRYPVRLGVTDWIRSQFMRPKTPEAHKKPTGYEGGKDKKLLCPKNAYWMELDEITIAEMLKKAGYRTCHIGKWHLGDEKWFPDKQGFDYNIGGCDFGQPPCYFDPYYRKGQGDIPTLKARRKGEYLTDRESDEAVNFITNHKDKPFFLYLANYAVHAPLQAKEEITKKYQQKRPTNQNNPIYAAMIQSVDEGVGKVVRTLKKLNLTNKTIIIFTSDNGGFLKATDNAPLRLGKGYPYEGGIRVPLIVRWPGVVKPGTVCKELVISVDYFPTVCQAAGVAGPKDRDIDGKSLMPLLKHTGSLKRDALYWHFPHYRSKDIVPYSIIRSGNWKLIKRYEGKKFELFNLKNDLSEKNDLSAKRPGKVRELNRKLVAWLKQTKAKMPIKNPEYQPKKDASVK